jgi:hypothetical protein
MSATLVGGLFGVARRWRWPSILDRSEGLESLGRVERGLGTRGRREGGEHASTRRGDERVGIRVFFEPTARAILTVT